MNTFSPFKQIAFENVPEAPRVPHHYGDAADKYITVESKHFGAVKTFYKTMGSGPDLLLVHGFMTTSYSCRYVIKPLAAHFRVIALDLPALERPAKAISGPWGGGSPLGLAIEISNWALRKRDMDEPTWTPGASARRATASRK